MRPIWLQQQGSSPGRHPPPRQPLRLFRRLTAHPSTPCPYLDPLKLDDCSCQACKGGLWTTWMCMFSR